MKQFRMRSVIIRLRRVFGFRRDLGTFPTVKRENSASPSGFRGHFGIYFRLVFGSRSCLVWWPRVWKPREILRSGPDVGPAIGPMPFGCYSEAIRMSFRCVSGAIRMFSRCVSGEVPTGTIDNMLVLRRCSPQQACFFSLGLQNG